MLQLAQDNQETLLEAYGMIVMIAAVGLVAVILVLSVIIARRMARRRTVMLEREIEKRRNDPGVPHADVWKTSSERYVDADALTPEEIAQRAAEDPGDDDSDATDTGSTWDDAIASEQQEDEGEDDPYGLFEDKPYVDPDPNDEEEEPDDGVDPDEPWR
ncbi:hypothetical protein OT109_09145 [Phycisphaeraceae bacterium D3-23]